MSSDTESECPICLDPLEPHTFYRFECHHRLHKDCFKQYVQYTYDIEKNALLCPICKQQIEVKTVSYIRSKVTIFVFICSITLVISILPQFN